MEGVSNNVPAYKGQQTSLGQLQANSTNKLCISVVAECLYKNAEHSTRSNAQTGFRKHKNTVRQLQNVVDMMWDTKVSQQG